MIDYDERVGFLPVISSYIDAAMRTARFESIDNGTTVYGEIPAAPGVYATGSTRAECEDELREVLEEWILLGVSLHHDLPKIDGVELAVPTGG